MRELSVVNLGILMLSVLQTRHFLVKEVERFGCTLFSVREMKVPLWIVHTVHGVCMAVVTMRMHQWSVLVSMIINSYYFIIIRFLFRIPPYSRETFIQGEPAKMFTFIIFLFVTSVEGKSLFRGKGHLFWVPKPKRWQTAKFVDKFKCSSLVKTVTAFKTWTISLENDV